MAGLGFVGWTVPSSIPTAALGGNSLFGAFTASIGEEMVRSEGTGVMQTMP